jgi:hypothetical protein
MEDVVQFSRHVHKGAHIVVVERELWVAAEVLQILHIPRDEVVHSEDLISIRNESVTQM